MSRTLQRKNLRFSSQAYLKSATNRTPILYASLRGTTSTMATLSGSVPTTWKTGLSAPTAAKLNALWGAVALLRSLVTVYNLHYHPSNLTPTTTAPTPGNYQLDVVGRPGYEELQKRTMTLARGVRLTTASDVEILGGTAMADTEDGNALISDASTVYAAQSFTGLLGDTDAESWLTAMSTQVADLLQALADNQLLQTA